MKDDNYKNPKNEKYDIYLPNFYNKIKYNKDEFIINIPKDDLLTNIKNAQSFNSIMSVLSRTSQTTMTQQVQTMNTNRRWSPQSSVGKIYEWNRGVISIGIDGTMEKENLDENFGAHHGGATVRTLNRLGINIENNEEDIKPFEMAATGSDLGAVVFQSEGDTAFVYLPVSPTSEQKEALESISLPRFNFSFSYVYNGEIFGNKSVDNLLEMVQNISNGKAR